MRFRSPSGRSHSSERSRVDAPPRRRANHITFKKSEDRPMAARPRRPGMPLGWDLSSQKQAHTSHTATRRGGRVALPVATPLATKAPRRDVLEHGLHVLLAKAGTSQRGMAPSS